MHESMFSYNISRPYPYKWFTWLVFIGGVVATFIFSLLNLAADGYNIDVVYTEYPNLTETTHNTHWYQRRPWSLASKVSPNCSSQMLSVGSQYYTNNYGFPYTLTNIVHNDQNTSQSSATLAYKNNYLYDCEIDSISIAGATIVDASTNAQIWAECTLHGEDTSSKITLESSFSVGVGGLDKSDSSPSTLSLVGSLPSLLQVNNRTQPSLYWGNKIVACLYSVLNAAINKGYLPNVDETVSWKFSRGDPSSPVDFQITVSLNTTQYDVSFISGSEMQLPEWYSASALKTLNTGSLIYEPRSDSHTTATHNKSSPIVYNDKSSSIVYVSTVLDQLGKSIYWTVLTDLGQNSTNVLAHSQDLCELIEEEYQFGSESPPEFYLQFASVPNTRLFSNASHFYDEVRTAPLEVKPAVFAQIYLCQLPRMKPAGSLIITIIVADLVFLQALWKILNWITTMIVERRNARAKFCVGCATLEDGNHTEVCEGVNLVRRRGEGIDETEPLAASSSRPVSPFPKACSSTDSTEQDLEESCMVVSAGHSGIPLRAIRVSEETNEAHK